MQLKIEKDVPTPQKRAALLRKMEVGDSVFIPGVKDATAGHNLYFNQAKRLGMKITISKENGGVRMWRIE